MSFGAAGHSRIAASTEYVPSEARSTATTCLRSATRLRAARSTPRRALRPRVGPGTRSRSTPRALQLANCSDAVRLRRSRSGRAARLRAAWTPRTLGVEIGRAARRAGRARGVEEEHEPGDPAAESSSTWSDHGSSRRPSRSACTARTPGSRWPDGRDQARALAADARAEAPLRMSSWVCSHRSYGGIDHVASSCSSEVSASMS